MSEGAVTGDLKIAFDLLGGCRHGGRHDFDQDRWKCHEAHQAAALGVGRVRSFGRRLLRDC